MDSIPPGRLLTLVRPGNDIVLRRIQNLKCCVQACGCNITTPRYAQSICLVAFGFLLAGFLAVKKTRFGWLLAWAGFLAGFLAGFCTFFLARLAETQLRGKLQAYVGVVMLQPHACTQHFRFRILRRTRSFPGRTSVRSLPGGIESIWETPSKERVSILPLHEVPKNRTPTIFPIYCFRKIEHLLLSKIEHLTPVIIYVVFK